MLNFRKLKQDFSSSIEKEGKDSQHLAALLFFLEQNIDQILVSFSKDNDLSDHAEQHDINEEAHAEIIEKVKEAQVKADQKQEQLNQDQLMQEYVSASHFLSSSPFFRAQEKKEFDRAEVAVIFNEADSKGKKGDGHIEMQLALRLPFRSKPLYVPHIKEYLQALRYEEPIFMGCALFGIRLFSLSNRLLRRRGGLPILIVRCLGCC